MSRQDRAHTIKADLAAASPHPGRPRDSAWERNARVSVFAKDYLGSATRERVPLVPRLAFDLLFRAIREGGSLAADESVVRDANDAAPGLVEALLAPEKGRLVFRNDWIDLPAACEASKGFSDVQRKRALARWDRGTR